MTLQDWNDRRLDDLARDVEALRDTPAQLSKLTEAVGANTKSAAKVDDRLDRLNANMAYFLVAIVVCLLGALVGVVVVP